MKPYLKEGCNRLVSFFFLIYLLFALISPSQVDAGQANVFIYHRFGESRFPSTNISLDLFAAHLAHIKESGRLVLPLSEIVNHLRAGRDIPGDVVAITVDDAFDSFLEKAMPLIREYRFPVTLFVNTDGVEAPGYLGWQQLRNLTREGVEIGNHTSTHDYLLERINGEDQAAWRKRVERDIQKAQDAFSREMGVRPELFAYPYGEYSPELQEIVKGLGFKAAIAQQSGVISRSSDLYSLPRFPMGGPYATLESFQSKISMHPLELDVVEPVTPVIANNNPPTLKVKISSRDYDLSRLQGFVQGKNRLTIEKVSGSEGTFVIQASGLIESRRNKYTLTAPLKNGKGWAWFSYPWFKLKSGF